MLTDFTQYISTHINEPIGMDDVTCNPTKVVPTFAKKSLTIGYRIAVYILHYTKKPLGEISSFLRFSSQSHFQNVFKKHCGMTPLEYRRGKI